MGTTAPGPDGEPRCHWCLSTPQYLHYHDTEWGLPVDDDFRLFEKLSLEGFQSGLSWRTILAKRENFRRAFLDFDYNKIARFGEREIEQRLQDAGIVRHRGKIEAVIGNAQLLVESARQEGWSLAGFVWQFQPQSQEVQASHPASTSAESISLSKALKKRGWKFVGPTTIYAFMQAMGLVNDHSEGCVVRSKVERARAKFRVPEFPA